MLCEEGRTDAECGVLRYYNIGRLIIELQKSRREITNKHTKICMDSTQTVCMVCCPYAYLYVLRPTC